MTEQKNTSQTNGTKIESDIHGYAKRLELALAQIQQSNLHEDDKRDILTFQHVLRTQKLNLGRVTKYVYSLKVIARFIEEHGGPQTTLKTAAKEQIEEFYLHLMEKADYKPHTKRDYVTTLKRFYQWLKCEPLEYPRWRKKHIYPPEVEDLDSSIKLNERFLPSDLFKDEEVNRMIDASPFVMVKAAIGILDEDGPRPGEFLNMRIKDVTFLSNGMVQLRLGHHGGGKTGERLVYLIKSVTLLTSWLNMHPMKDDPDAPLWVNLWNPKSGRRIGRWSYNAMNKIVRETAERAGIKRGNITAYLFRHTAATRDARNGFNEALLCAKYGWAMGSKMPRIYIHLAGNDLQAKTLQVYGGTEVEKPKPQSVTCPKCKLNNHPTNECCSRCGSVLDASRVVDLEQRDLQTGAQLTAMQDEIDQLVEMLREHGFGKEVQGDDSDAELERESSPLPKPNLHSVLMTEEQFKKWQATNR